MGHQNTCSHQGCHHEEHGQGTCPCCCHTCGHSHHHEDHHDHQDFAKQLIDLADEAWMCLLKEKIRNHVENSAGKQLDELAKLVADSNNNRWKIKMEGDRGCKEFKQKVSDFFSKKS